MAFDGIKEILVLHHSHMDIGYTHTPPVVWEFQREFLVQVMDYLELTADWPEVSQPRWTCEVTSQVKTFLELADPEDIERFTAHVRSGRIGLTAGQHNIIATLNAEQLIRQLAEIGPLRERFGDPITTFAQNDVNGIPWSLVDLLADSGVELVTMAINLYYGGCAAERPGIFRWEGPSGREVLVCNGEHYSMFNFWGRTEKHSIPEMQAGLDEYIQMVRGEGWDHDFIYLTMTNAPYAYDNTSIEREAAELIKEWNETGAGPTIRYVTPAMLLERIKQIPRESLKVHRGDWTDYWTLGIACSADETRMQRRAKSVMFTSELMQSVRDDAPSSTYNRLTDRAWWNINCYDEHTWGAARAMNHEHPNTKTQWHFKQNQAYLIREDADFLLTDQLEHLAGNETSSWTVEAAALVNPSPVKRTFYVPRKHCWTWDDTKHLRLGQFHIDYDVIPPLEIVAAQADGHALDPSGSVLAGPIEMEPFSWKMVSLADLPDAPDNANVTVGDGVIESPFHRLEFDSVGNVTGLLDKRTGWQAVAENDTVNFAQLVRETVGGDGTRREIFERDLEEEIRHRHCVKADWPANYEFATPTGFRIEHDASGATLVTDVELFGMRSLEQRITLRGEDDTIEVRIQLFKEDVRNPESVFLAMPVNVQAGWAGHFDLTGSVVALDDDQMEGSCRDWASADSFAEIGDAEHSLALFTPDCPLVMFGEFAFQRRRTEVPREAGPLLLGWPMNNMFDTNFRASQPGFIHLRFGLRTSGAFDAAQTLQAARAFAVHPVAHPVNNLPDVTSGSLVELAGENVDLMHVKPAEDGRGAIVRLQNVGDVPTTARVKLAGAAVTQAFEATILEDDGAAVSVVDGYAEMELTPRRITTLRLMR
jgi:alpha-mannosidase